jgi:hypothetical protein
MNRYWVSKDVMIMLSCCKVAVVDDVRLESNGRTNTVFLLDLSCC